MVHTPEYSDTVASNDSAAVSNATIYGQAPGPNNSVSGSRRWVLFSHPNQKYGRDSPKMNFN